MSKASGKARLARLTLRLGLALTLGLAGCSLFPTTRHLPVPEAPATKLTATPRELVDRLNQRWDGLNTLTATVEMQATETKTAQGEEKAFPSARGYILLRKPKMLRVLGQYFGVRIFDMSTNGTRFKMYIPPKSLAIEGSNTVKERSANPLENLRPDFFMDAIVVRGLSPDDYYAVTADTDILVDPSRKHLYTVPEYDLSITREKANSHEEIPVRVITFHRSDLLPYAQQLYDEGGNLETQITYSSYANFNGTPFPSKVTIRRPKEGIEIVLTVERVEENVKLADDQFEVKIPAGTKIKTLH
jgi:outer membrane lipoprotein-sorting protein